MEKHFTQVENETLEALARVKLSGREHSVIWAILRLTNGYHLRENKLALKYLSQLTNLSYPHLSRILKRLAAKQIIYRENSTCAMHPPGLWVALYRKESVAEKGNSTLPPVAEKGNKKLPKKATKVAEKGNSSEAILKLGNKTIKENINKTGTSSEVPSLLETEKRKVINELQEKREYRSGRPAAEAKAISQMLKEGYTAENILACYDAMKSEGFWRDRPLFMMSVRAQIGEYQKRGFQPIPQRGMLKDNGQQGARRVAATRTMEDFATGSW